MPEPTPIRAVPGLFRSPLSIQARVTEILEALGNTPAAVAESLIAGGHFGLLNLCSRCPIATCLLRSDLSPEMVEVTGVDIALTFLDGDNVYTQRVQTTYAVRHFIHAFDAELYPELIQGSEQVTA